MGDEYTTHVGDHELAPESLMMGYGYHPEWSEGAIKSPIFQTSTFTFASAAQGKRYFELAYGLDEPKDDEEMGLIYSRLNNPDLEILEKRLTLWDGAEKGLAFASGMAAIATTILTFAKPGSVVVHSTPLYGGTDHLMHHTLPGFGIDTVTWRPGHSIEDVTAEIGNRTVAAVFVETPSNPCNDMFSIRAAADLASRFRTDGNPVPVAVDNTFLGPIWQSPLEHGADLAIYSATKFLGGHSDLIAGAVLGPDDLITQVTETRTILGTMATPLTGWLLMRSLETLDMRMRRQSETAEAVATFLDAHPAVEKVHYLGLLTPNDRGHDVYTEQCKGPGSMISFWLDADEETTFQFLDALQLIHLAVSLGSTESLIEHPATMTHAGVDPLEKKRLDITESLVRLSVGVERLEDLIADLTAALGTINE